MTTETLTATDVARDATVGPDQGAPTADRPLLRRGSLAGVLLLTLVLYTWDLSASGYANSFYSAAAQAGSQSWEAFFYGSLDGSNWITVDKTPASLWLMALSVRLFGLSSWSILMPQALLGVASAWVLYATVRRSLTGPVTKGWSISPQRAHWAGIVAAAAFALTPAATLMFRFNNPDALMVFCYVAASYATVRAIETASRRWLAGAGALIGLGFLAKMLQAFVILPALVLAYAVAAPATWRKKVLDLLTAFASMVLAFGWWVAIVELVPESWRPYIGGSQTNSIIELAFGYNGLGRLNGNETGSVGGGGGGRWGEVGLLRMFVTVSGEMVSWLLPAALLLAALGLVVLGRPGWRNALRGGASTTATRATGALVLFAGWLVINTLVFSYMAGIYHDYYTVALAPAIAGAVAIGGALLWERRTTWIGRVGLAMAALGTAAWGVALASVAGGVYLAISIGAAASLGLTALIFLMAGRLPSWLSATALGVAVLASLAGPAAYSINTAATPHTGSIVTAGPTRGGILSSTSGGPGGPGNARGPRMTPGQLPPGATAPGGAPNGASPGQDGGRGALLNGASVSAELLALLTTNADQYDWVAAAVGAQNAASYQLASGDPVLAIGGFNGSDPSPTLAQFQDLVTQGRIHYFIGGGGLGNQNGGSDASSQIADWVQEHYTATSVGGTTVYDLTKAAS